MKKIKPRAPRTVPLWKIGLFVLIVTMVALAIMYGDSKAADFNYPVRCEASGHDSLYVQWLRRVTGINYTATGDTMIMGAALPISLVVPVADTADWIIRRVYYWSTVPIDAPTIDLPYKTGSSATLSTDDYDSIAARVNDGNGPNIVTVYAVDTSGDDAAVPGAIVTCMDVARTYNIRQGRTDATGILSFYTSADSLAVLVEHLPYHFFPAVWDTITPTPVGATTTISGYDVPDTSGSTTDRTCLVKIYINDNNGQPAKGILVSMALQSQGRVVDSAGHAIANSVRTDRTDSLGIASFVCLWSSYLVPATDWRIQVLSPGFGSLSKVITVPRDTIYTVNLLTD